MIGQETIDQERIDQKTIDQDRIEQQTIDQQTTAADPVVAPPVASDVPPAPVYRPFGWLLRFRLIPKLEAYPRVVAFAQSIAGKITLLALFGLGLYCATWLHYLRNPRWKAQICFLIVITALPKYRRVVLTVATLLWAFGIWWQWAEHPQIIQAGISIVVAGAIFWLASRFHDSPGLGGWFGRRLVATLLTAFALTVLLASYLPSGGSLRSSSFSFLSVFAAYIWFLAYSLMDLNSKSRDPYALQVGGYHPIWGSSSTPFPKGSSYLRRIEAKNAEQLAVAQLKGLKLLAWSIVLDLFLTFVYMPFVHGYLMVPFYEFVWHLSVTRAHFSWYMGWGSLISEFLERMIEFAIFGHRIIAVCRMAGFMALRNTYRPLSSRTLAEFWNRYYYYFKELLADCFFYPAFLKYFKQLGRWRLFAATFAAAGFGNAFFHFFRDVGYIEDLGFWRALVGFQSYIFYTIVLSVGIGISQMRQPRKEKLGWIRGRLIPTLCVSSFFCILRVFDYTYKRYPIQESFRFLAHLLNLVS